MEKSFAKLPRLCIRGNVICVTRLWGGHRRILGRFCRMCDRSGLCRGCRRIGAVRRGFAVSQRGNDGRCGDGYAQNGSRYDSKNIPSFFRCGKILRKLADPCMPRPLPLRPVPEKRTHNRIRPSSDRLFGRAKGVVFVFPSKIFSVKLLTKTVFYCMIQVSVTTPPDRLYPNGTAGRKDRQ